MKKLMIAALVAAMGGVAMADDCSEPVGCAFAYRIKLAGKCTSAKYKAAASECVEGNCWAKPKSYRVAGYFYGTGECGECTCPLTEDFAYHFWDAEKKEVQFDTVEISLYEILRNSGAQNKAQMLITLGGLNLAGYGTFKPSKHTLLSANGFFAGTLEAPMCSFTVDCEDDEAAANVFDPCGLEAGEAAAAIAYGRWSLTYKDDKSAALKKSGIPDDGYPKCLLPAAFQYAE